jgi:hypothetical protein
MIVFGLIQWNRKSKESQVFAVVELGSTTGFLLSQYKQSLFLTHREKERKIDGREAMTGNNANCS